MTITLYKNIIDKQDFLSRDLSTHHYILSGHEVSEEVTVSLLTGGFDFRYDDGTVRVPVWATDLIDKVCIDYVYVTRRVSENRYHAVQNIYKELYTEFFTLVQDILACNHTDTWLGSYYSKEYKNFRITSDLYIEDVSLDNVKTGDVVSFVKQIDYSFEHRTHENGKYPINRSIVFVMDISITEKEVSLTKEVFEEMLKNRL